MDDYDLGAPIQDAALQVNDNVRHRSRSGVQSNGDATPRPSGEGKRDPATDPDEPSPSTYTRAKRWWLASTGFPLIAGTFGPLANLFSVCALVQTWRVRILPGGTETTGERVADPHWVLAPNVASLALAVIANVFLLMNFGRRLRYTIAQPLTVVLWYLSFALLLIPLALTKHLILYPQTEYAFSQSYYYAIISSSVYFVISTLLLANLLGALVFKAYPPSFGSLTVPQRTLMLQTTSYVFYLALGAGVFASIEGWAFVDGLYWADYTLLTCGLGTDFPLYHTLSRALLMPYAVIGITMIGLVIGSIRALVLDRGATAMVQRRLEKERTRWLAGLRDVKDVQAWEKREFEAMRRIQKRADFMRRYMALATSSFAFAVLWLVGALVFWYSENLPQNWTYFDALYFAYTTLLTVGYGDFYPQSNAGKPFFVLWTLMAVPTMTVLISNMGDTVVVSWVKQGVLWVAERTVMPNMVQEYGGGSGLGNGSGQKNEFAGEVEKLGAAVQGADEEMAQDTDGQAASGRAGLIRRLAQEVRAAARDVGTEKTYEWEEWSRWMTLVGDADEWLAENRGGWSRERRSERSQDNRSEKSQEDTGGFVKPGTKAEREEVDAEEQLSWLAYDGPMFSDVDEAQWVLTRLCEKLEQILIHE